VSYSHICVSIQNFLKISSVVIFGFDDGCDAIEIYYRTMNESWVHGQNNFCVARIWFSRQSVVTDKSIVVF
jgi:hypothetical protein